MRNGRLLLKDLKIQIGFCWMQETLLFVFSILKLGKNLNWKIYGTRKNDLASYVRITRSWIKKINFMVLCFMVLYLNYWTTAALKLMFQCEGFQAKASCGDFSQASREDFDVKVKNQPLWSNIWNGNTYQFYVPNVKWYFFSTM